MANPSADEESCVTCYTSDVDVFEDANEVIMYGDVEADGEENVTTDPMLKHSLSGIMTNPNHQAKYFRSCMLSPAQLHICIA